LLERHEHSKPLEDRIAQKVCEALRNLNLNKQQFDLLLPLASDPILGGELARQILAERYSPDEVAKLIVNYSPSAVSIGNEVMRLASLWSVRFRMRLPMIRTFAERKRCSSIADHGASC